MAILLQHLAAVTKSPQPLPPYLSSLAQILLSKPFRIIFLLTASILLLYSAFQNTYVSSALVAIPSVRFALHTDPDSGSLAGTGEAQPAAPPTDWGRFAYTQYVTNSDYLCNSLMLFEALGRMDSKADRLMMYPHQMLEDPKASEPVTRDSRMLVKARDKYGVKLVPITVQHRKALHNDKTWEDSYTKLLAFNQTAYDRVLSLDSDSTVLQSMDELFLLPPAPIAMPRAYWLLPEKKLSSQLLLVQPSETEFMRILNAINEAAPNRFDMEILNDIYGDTARIMPHRPYNLLTGEFRSRNHSAYLGSRDEHWNPVAAFNEAKFLHFSDWPVPKPWKRISKKILRENQPVCEVVDGREDCTQRELWNGFYTDFKRRRQDICGKDGEWGYEWRNPPIGRLGTMIARTRPGGPEGLATRHH